ncbi:MAG TPA: VOC family protein [Chthoniobacterales bacterium]|jgi:PhnB protein
MKTTDQLASRAKVEPVPAKYHTVSPYLIVRNAAAALDFYVGAFGAIECRRMANPDGKIMHAEMKIGDSMIMLADEFPSHQALSPEHFGGSPMFLVLHVENADARFKQAIGAGATALRPLADQFSGDRSGTVLDPFGHRWTLTTHIEDVSEAEMGRRFTEMMKSADRAGNSDPATSSSE